MAGGGTREERVPGEHRHRNGVSGIAAITIAVEDVTLLRHWLTSVLRQDGEPLQREDMLARGMRFAAGPHGLEFLAPDKAASPLSPWLETRGAGPWSVTLKTAASTGTLDEHKARARIMLVH